MLKIEHLTKKYGDKVAVDDLNIEIKSGEIYGFIGHNGAGKTTTLKACCGILPFEEGNITINGLSIKDNPIECKKIMAYIPDNPDLYGYMTANKYLNFICDIYQIDKSQRKQLINKYADLFELTNDLGQTINGYSHGMKQKLALIAALIHDPKLIIMDDSANVVSGAKSAFWKAILQTNASTVKTPSDVDENSPTYYIVKGLTRQERYYSEIGQKSKAEKAKFISSKRSEGMTDEEINMELARIENQTKPRIPDEFVFDGCMIIIGNMTEEELARSTSQTGGKMDWKAVRDRFNLCVVEPPSEIIWKKIKEKLRDEQ